MPVLDCFMDQQQFSQLIVIKMEAKTAKATSYKDLLQHFQQADKTIQTPQQKKSNHRPLNLKKTNYQKQNKENLVHKNHMQSMQQKSLSQKSEWIQEDVLRQYSQRRKDRQLQLSYNKFIAYITHMLSTLTGLVPPQLLTSKLTYLQYLAALKEMVFIKQTYEPSPQDSVAQLWNQLGSHGQTIGAFILFIASILNMRKGDEQSTSKFVYLSKKYADLRFTRMEMLGKVKTIQDEEQYPFTPSISQRSRTLAASRSKSKGRTDRCIAQKSYNQMLQQSPETQNLRSQIQNRNSHLQPLDEFLGNRRSQILYKLAKQKSLQKRRDKKSNEVQYQKSIKQLTFHPKIHPNLNKEKQSKKNIHGEQDSIDRMIRGRIEREVRKIIQDKGLPYNQKLFQRMKKERYQALQKQRQNQHINSRKQQEQQQQPEFLLPTKMQSPSPMQQTKVIQPKKNKKQPIVLLIQVDQGHCEKLIIEDVTRYKEAAAKFIKDFNLKPQMYEKLIDGVQNALKFQLTPINEVPYESEYESVD